MKYWYQSPNQKLSDLVRTVVVLEGFTHETDAKLPLFTNGMPTLYCRIEKGTDGNEHMRALTLFGKSTIEDCWVIDENTTVVAYFFKPFAMATLFNIPASQLVKAPVDLRAWNAHKVNALRTQLAYALPTTSKVEAMDNFLIHQLEQNGRECGIIQYATDQMMENSDPEILTVILNKLNVNQRTFQRIFKKYVGVTPSQYRRICQFQLSFSQLRAKKFETLTDVAYDNGFADQSHFIRSFRGYTAVTPMHYLKSGLKRKKR